MRHAWTSGFALLGTALALSVTPPASAAVLTAQDGEAAGATVTTPATTTAPTTAPTTLPTPLLTPPRQAPAALLPDLPRSAPPLALLRVELDTTDPWSDTPASLATRAVATPPKKSKPRPLDTDDPWARATR